MRIKSSYGEGFYPAYYSTCWTLGISIWLCDELQGTSEGDVILRAVSDFLGGYFVK